MTFTGDKPAGASVLRCLRGGLIVAGVLLVNDVLLSGSFLLSAFVVPIWLLLEIAKAIFGRNSRPATIRRILISLVTLGLVFGNAWLQSRMARANAERIIKACTHYRTGKGVYSTKLTDLVPRYLRSVPRAKYALIFWDSFYEVSHDEHTLMWVEVPPFGRPYYDFEKAQWRFMD
jgi:hypothetical protein